MLAASLVGVVLMCSPCSGRVPPLDQQRQPSASSPAHIADDEWMMIEAACHNQKLKSHAAYMDCLGRQVKALDAGTGKPSLAGVSSDERAMIESACKIQRLSRGPAAYYSCLRQQLAAPNAIAARASTLAAKTKEPATENPSGREAPRPSPPGARAAQPASSPSAEAAKEQAGPASPAAAPDSANSASAISVLEVLAILAAAAIGVWFSWKAYRGVRGPKCARCARRFKGSGAYCAKCIAAFQAAAQQAAAQQRHAEQQARDDEWNRQGWRAAEPSGEHRQHEPQPRSEPDGAFDPYVVLGVARNASKEDIRAAYLRQMAIYHPDKVAHLGEDLQELAKRKAQAINRAYEELLQATG